jgi:Zn-dependent oligopeptidase
MLILVILSAEINATDIFQQVFAPDPRSRQAWTRFRQLVLKPGGSKSDLDIIKSILGGRLPDSQALSSMIGKP